MSTKRFTEEFKIETVKQITERGHAVAEVAGRLGVSTHSLYQWTKHHSVSLAWTSSPATSWILRCCALA